MAIAHHLEIAQKTINDARAASERAEDEILTPSQSRLAKFLAKFLPQDKGEGFTEVDLGTNAGKHKGWVEEGQE